MRIQDKRQQKTEEISKKLQELYKSIPRGIVIGFEDFGLDADNLKSKYPQLDMKTLMDFVSRDFIKNRKENQKSETEQEANRMLQRMLEFAEIQNFDMDEKACAEFYLAFCTIIRNIKDAEFMTKAMQRYAHPAYAKGLLLDKWGDFFGIKRSLNETYDNGNDNAEKKMKDDVYRDRIQKELSGEYRSGTSKFYSIFFGQFHNDFCEKNKEFEFLQNGFRFHIKESDMQVNDTEDVTFTSTMIKSVCVYAYDPLTTIAYALQLQKTNPDYDQKYDINQSLSYYAAYGYDSSNPEQLKTLSTHSKTLDAKLQTDYLSLEKFCKAYGGISEFKLDNGYEGENYKKYMFRFGDRLFFERAQLRVVFCKAWMKIKPIYKNKEQEINNKEKILKDLQSILCEATQSWKGFLHQERNGWQGGVGIWMGEHYLTDFFQNHETFQKYVVRYSFNNSKQEEYEWGFFLDRKVRIKENVFVVPMWSNNGVTLL